MSDGRKLSPEHRAKLSEYAKNRPPGHRANLKAAMKGKKIGSKHTAETRAKMSASRKGHPTSAETRAKMSEAMKGKTHTPEARAKISAAAIRQMASPLMRAKLSAAKIGKTLSAEHRASIGAAGKGRTPSAETRARISAAKKGSGNGRKLSKKTCLKMSASRRGLKRSAETRLKMSVSRKMNFLDPAYCSKMKKAWGMKPNKPETFLTGLLEEMFPGEWEYTGDFRFMINGKNPDFVNSDRNKVIEFFGDYWHRDRATPEERAAVFAPFGYKTLVIWESELKNMKAVVNRIAEFASA